MGNSRIAALVGAVGGFSLEGALQVSGYTNIPLAVGFGTIGIGCVGYLLLSFKWPRLVARVVEPSAMERLAIAEEKRTAAIAAASVRAAAYERRALILSQMVVEVTQFKTAHITINSAETDKLKR